MARKARTKSDARVRRGKAAGNTRSIALKAKPLPDARVAEQIPASRGEWLARILRDRILKGQYRPGARIREIELKEEFNLSNGPVRDAFQFLAAEGLLDRAPSRGIRVVQLGPAEITALFHLRLALLEYAAERAARNIDERSKAEARALKKTLKAALSGVRSGDLGLMNGELMQWVLKTAGNKPIAETWNRTMDQTRIYVYQAMLRTAAKMEPHQYRLIDAIASGNVDAARKAARELTRQTLLDLKIDADI